MRALLLVTFVCALFAHAYCSDVVDLTHKDFNSAVGEYKIILVDFFAPWCHFCKELEPEYNAAATTLLTANPPIHIAKVDCVANKAMCTANGVRGYPTVKLFKNGKFVQNYPGARTRTSIVDYMKREAGQ